MTAVSDPSRRGSGGTLAGGVEGSLLIFVSVIEEWVRRRTRSPEGGLGPRPSFSKKDRCGGHGYPAECPHVIDVFPDSLRCEVRRGEDSRNGRNRISAVRPAADLFSAPSARVGPAVQVPAVMFKVIDEARAVYFEVALSLSSSHAAAHHDPKSTLSFPLIRYWGPLQFRR